MKMLYLLCFPDQDLLGIADLVAALGLFKPNIAQIADARNQPLQGDDSR